MKILVLTVICGLMFFQSCSIKKRIHICETAPDNWPLASVDVEIFKSMLNYQLSDDDLNIIDNPRAIWHKNPDGEVYWICIPPKDFYHTNCGEVGKAMPLDGSKIDINTLTKIIVCGS